MSNSIKVRMAPSPTGEYHIGHIRTALYNWAFAKKLGGTFLIRIEDTDRTRFVEGATERILQVLTDYGLSWDEGPIHQSERLSIYKKHAEKLVESGHAYYCFCTEERLNQMREEQKARKLAVTKYDRRCRNLTAEDVQEKLSSGTLHVVRLKVPDDRAIAFTDEVYGTLSFPSNDIEDQILLKSDGFPTYHLAVVVDDHLMEVTHVMRGNDWLPSTPKHVLLYEAFGWEMPVYIHLPNLKEIGANKKLSKRFGPVSAREFLDEGYLPEAALNFLMFLGWNPGTEKEIYSLTDFTTDFDIKKIHKTDLVAFDRMKLNWYNSEYIRLMDDRELAMRVKPFAHSSATEDVLLSIVPLVKGRIKKLSEFQGLTNFFFERPQVDPAQFNEHAQTHLSAAFEVLEKTNPWTLESLTKDLMEVVERNQFKTGDFFMNLRIAVAGQKVSPPINESMVILGQPEVCARLEAALKLV